MRDALGLPSERVRPLRAGDYSFNQIGPTGLYMLLSNIPAEERKRRGYYAVGGCGGNIAWHTPDDLMPVADLEILRAKAQRRAKDRKTARADVSELDRLAVHAWIAKERVKP